MVRAERQEDVKAWDSAIARLVATKGEVKQKQLDPTLRAAWMRYARLKPHREQERGAGERRRPIKWVAYGSVAVILLLGCLAVLWQRHEPQTQTESKAAVERPSVDASSQTPQPAPPAVILTPTVALVNAAKPRDVASSTRISKSESKKLEPVSVTILADVWADVVLDGKPSGRIPRAKPFFLTPGRHDLSLINPFAGSKHEVIIVPNQKAVTLQFKMKGQN